MEILSAYELRIQKNLEDNKRILQSLGFSLGAPYQPKVSKSNYARKSVQRSKERQSIPQVDFRPTRINTRRSSSILLSNGFNDSVDSHETKNDEENTPPQKKSKIEPSFGEIKGVRVGDWWPSRLDCSAAGVHRPTVAGIHGKQDEGCYSIALSGGYEDDLDCGTYFTYTGCGGRDLKGTKCKPKNLRTAPQSKDQVFEGLNAALAFNIENKKPVRVIRGFKLQSNFAPEEGYRYDGLYSVEKYWTATGLSGFKVYKFALKRLENQDPPPWESCEEEKYFPPKELSCAESIIIPTQVDKMDTVKSVSPHKSSSKLSPKISSRGRPRKQSSPKQHGQNNCINALNTEELFVDFLNGFKEDLESDNEVPLFEDALKATENIINHTKNNPDSSLFKEQINTNDTSPTQNTKSVSLKENLPNNVSKLNSSEKKVRFSQTVVYHEEYNKDIQTQPAGNEKYGSNDNMDMEVENNSDGKKQTSILNYFSRIKTPQKTMNAKSLRSCRFSSFFNASSNDQPKYSEISITKHSPTYTSAPSAESGCTSIDRKPMSSPAKRSSSHKRKYSSSLTKNKEFDLDFHTMSKTGPSVIDNLIKQNSEKLKLHKKITPTETKTEQLKRNIILVKPCSVVLERIKIPYSCKRIKIQDSCKSGNSWLGWDLEGPFFVGFDKTDSQGAQRTYDNLKGHFCTSYSNTLQDRSEKFTGGFHGW